MMRLSLICPGCVRARPAESMPLPAETTQEWVVEIRERPKAFRRDVHKAALLDIATNHALGIAAAPKAQVSIPTGPMSCPECDRSFATVRGLAAQRAKLHKYRHPATRFASLDGKCRACLKGFHRRWRLICHLRECERKKLPCLRALESLGVRPSDQEVQEEEARERELFKKARAAGRQRPDASLPVLVFRGPRLRAVHDVVEIGL